ncbi:synaptic vesicular amine transporter-like [Octopus vulgaris]|uniref:Synaptic vesicular amine transporter-like n=1 Tax=Octopus vulgaris TaxID=6645 RepID=A0AA36AJ15_OCTVU|nr:synaptic vesicular amine transporter-like [Octopus vulgaris]
MVSHTISLFNYGIYSDVFIRIFRSRRMVLFIIFYTLLLDNFLLTALVPIIPDYLIEKDKEQLKQTLRGYHLKVFDNRTSLQIVVNRTQYINFTGNFSNSPDVGGRFSIVQDIFSIPLNKLNENTRVGWLLSSKAIVQLMFNFLVGPFTNRCGYVIPVFVGCLIIMLSACLFIFGETYIPLFMARSLHGLGSACVTIAGMGMIADKYPEDKERSKAMGIAMGGSAAGVLAGYPLGGCMYIYIGKFAPFLLIVVLTAIDSVLLVLFLRSNTAEQLSESGKSIWKLVQDPYILLVSGAIMLTTIALSSLEPTVPIWIMQTMNAEKWQIGLAFVPDSVGYLIGTNGFGVIARSLGRWICTLCCMLIIGLCCFFLPFASSISQLIMPHFGIGLGLGITDAALMPLLALLVDRRHNGVYGGVYSISQIAVCLAYALGPSISGHVVKSYGFVTLLRSIAVVNILYAPLCWFLRDVSTGTESAAILSHTQKGNSKYTDDEDSGNFSYHRFENE